jgi:DNA modification methylase
LPYVDFAFADPPYGVQADEWDGVFFWDHDWLIEKAPIVAVTPGQPAIVEFSRKTAMPYRNSMASWITNGMTLSEFGFQNWIYLAVFARDGISIFRQCQDVIRCTIDLSTTLESNHRGRKPAELLTKLIELYCPEDGAVIDPFLGSGTTLLVADTMNRVCYGGELNPDYCWRIIQRWEYQTGNKAVKR